MLESSEVENVSLQKVADNKLYRVSTLTNAVLMPASHTITIHTVMCVSIGTPKNNKFSICSKWKIYYIYSLDAETRTQKNSLHKCLIQILII